MNLAVVGGSDSHRPERIGRAWTAFRRSEARACEDLRAAIASRATESGGVDDPLVHGIPLFASQVFHGMMSRIHPRDRRA